MRQEITLQDDEAEVTTLRIASLKNGNFHFTMTHSLMYCPDMPTEVQKMAFSALEALVAPYGDSDVRSCEVDGKDMMPELLAKK